METVIALLPAILNGIPQVIKWVSTIRSAAQQTGEWTEDLELQYQAALQATRYDPAWQPDAE